MTRIARKSLTLVPVGPGTKSVPARSKAPQASLQTLYLARLMGLSGETRSGLTEASRGVGSAGMKHLLLVLAVVLGQSLMAADEEPVGKEQSAIVEEAIRKSLKKPAGKLTKADLKKVKSLHLGSERLTEIPKGLEKLTQLEKLWLGDNSLTDVKGMEKLTELEELRLYKNPDLTKAQIAELQKALPNCKIYSDATK